MWYRARMPSASERRRYEQAANRVLRAAREWRKAHPNGCLTFQSLGYPAGVVVAASLAPLIDRLAGDDPDARSLLQAMQDAEPSGDVTIMMADAAIEMVFGISRALMGPGSSAVES
jgi:hypothetical protein